MHRHLYSDTPQKSLRHFKQPVTLLEEWSFRLLALLVCLWRLFLVGHRTWLWHNDSAIGNPLMSVLLWLVASVGKLHLYGLSFVVHQRSCSSIFCWYSCQFGFPASFLQAYSHSSAPVSCIRIASLLTTFVPLFCPVFFWIELFESHLFLPCKGSVMLRRTSSFLCGRYRCDQ